MRTFILLFFAFFGSLAAVGQPSISLGTVQSINATLEGGSDIGAQINNAVAQLPSGGEIYIPAASTCYQFNVSIVINAPIILRGDGASTCLSYTGSGTAMTWTGGTWGSVMRDLTLQTPNAASGSVAGTTGIFLNGIAGIQAFNVNVSGFGVGLTFGSDTWLVSWHDGLFSHNAVALNFPPGIADVGENMTFDHTAFANGTQTDGVSTGLNCVMIDVTPRSNSSEFNFIDNSFDGCQVVIGENWESATRFINPHFEDVQGSLDYPFLKITTGLDPTKGSNVVLTNPNFMLDATQAIPDAFIELDNNATLSISNAVAQGWGGLSAPNAWVSIKGTGSAVLSMSGTFHIVHDAGQIPLYKTDGVNQPQVKMTRPTNVLSVPVNSDGDVVLAQGVLTGDYWITWGDQNDRHQGMKVSVSNSYYSANAAVNILANYAYQGSIVISNLRTVLSNGVPQLVATLGNRNQANGPLTVQWSGDGVSQPQLLPGTAVGTTVVPSYGLQQMPDGSTAVAGGMKLLPGAQPACNQNNAGLFWYLQGATGTADSVQVCARDASGGYGWRVISLALQQGNISLIPGHLTPTNPIRTVCRYSSEMPGSSRLVIPCEPAF